MKKFLLIFLWLLPIAGKSQVTIQMQEDGGVYKVPCEVNGLRMKFIFDTGASNVCLSLTEAKFMYENEYITDDDILGSSKAQIADGSIVENTRIRLKEIKIAGLVLRNVEAVVTHSFGAPLLLGQSAIQKLGRIQISGNELTIIEHENDKSDAEIDKLFEEAGRFFNNRSYSVAARKYQELYDLGTLSDYGIYLLAYSYYFTNHNERAIQYLLKINDFRDIDKASYHQVLGHCYSSLKDYDNALYHYELESEYDVDKSKHFGGKHNIAITYESKGDYYKAERCYNELIELYYPKLNGISMSDYIKLTKSGRLKEDAFEEYLFGKAYCTYMKEKTRENLDILRGMANYGNKRAIEFLEYIGVDYHY